MAAREFWLIDGTRFRTDDPDPLPRADRVVWVTGEVAFFEGGAWVPARINADYLCGEIIDGDV